MSDLALRANTQIALTSSSFSLEKDRFVRDSIAVRVKKTFHFGYSKVQALKIIDYVLKKIEVSKTNPSMKKDVILLGNRIVRLFFRSRAVKKAIIVLDRSLAQIRLNHGFLLKENKKLFEKWISSGFKKEFFYKYPKFSHFLIESNLASQMKITEDGIREVDGEGAILVEGRWTKFSEIEKRFFYKYSSKYREVFVYEKKTNNVFTYLPNKKGLQRFHPYLNAFEPVGQISDSEYQRVAKEAQKFQREYKGDKKEYSHVFQIVTSKTFGSSGFFGHSNFSEFTKSQHPYIRFIDARTKQVYILGYTLGFKARLNILKTFSGKFRSLDVWEYVRCKEKIVTNIALNNEEKQRLFNFCKRFINDDIKFGRKIAFHYMRQNCTSFIKNAIEYAINQKINTELKIHEIIYCIAPNILRRLGSFIKNSVLSIKNKGFSVFPRFISRFLDFLIAKINKIWRAILAFGLSIIASFLGAFRGLKARKLKNPDSKDKFSPFLRNVYNWFNYSSFSIDLPSKLVFWQLKQKSTKVFEKPRILRFI